MWRLNLIMAAIILLAPLPCSGADRPNILFMFSDDHAYQAVSAYGSGLNKTPNIDRIAREGMRFDRCVVTNSLCGPSRACILTGKYSHKNGFYDNTSRFDGTQVTFPKLLQRAGYQTAIVGKWHLVSDPTGFDFWKVLPGQGRYYSPVFITPEGRVTEPGYVTDIITRDALAWLKEGRDGDKPFLLMVQHKAPHREWAPGPRHVGDFKEQEFPEPPTLFDDYRGRSSAAARATMRIGKDMTLNSDLKVWRPGGDLEKRMSQLMSPEELAAWSASYDEENRNFRDNPPESGDLVRWKYQRYIKDYLRCIASIDDSVGQLLEYLDKSGLAENTIVIYASDQGFYLGEHGWFDKRFMYEESFRTPFVVRWPGTTEPGSVESRIVSNLDFAQTFLEAAGVEAPLEMQGRSLVPLLKKEAVEDWRKSFYYHYYEGPPAVHTVAEHYGVATDRFKLIHYYKLDEWELFDRESDPQEMHSVYDDPAYAQTRAELSAELTRLRAELGITANDPPRAQSVRSPE
jgi:arylsulfatase A-like enzyme